MEKTRFKSATLRKKTSEAYIKFYRRLGGKLNAKGNFVPFKKSN